LEDALLRGEVDLAVHSTKDMPGQMPEGLCLAAVLERANTADVLVTKDFAGLAGLPKGAHVGTSSVRRARQLLDRRPDLALEEIRGNVPTRLRKLRDNPELHATVLAQAGLERLGFTVMGGQLAFEETLFRTEILDHLPAIGQGAIAIQCRTQDASLFAAINHQPTWLAVRAERELMRLLNGDCTLPVGVGTEIEGEAMKMRVILFGAVDESPKRADVSGPAASPEAVAAAAYQALHEPSH
jgi:hydroxymethylbilane synthase